jgi:hypothetical protein
VCPTVQDNISPNVPVFFVKVIWYTIRPRGSVFTGVKGCSEFFEGEGAFYIFAIIFR